MLPTGATPRQTQERLVLAASLGEEARDALARLVGALEQVRYAARSDIDGRPRRTSPKMSPSSCGPCAATTERAQRLRARVLPRSGTEVLLGLSARASDRIAGLDRTDRPKAPHGRPTRRVPGTRRAGGAESLVADPTSARGRNTSRYSHRAPRALPPAASGGAACVPAPQLDLPVNFAIAFLIAAVILRMPFPDVCGIPASDARTCPVLPGYRWGGAKGCSCGFSCWQSRQCVQEVR